MFDRDWTMSSNIHNYCTFNGEHNWEDLCNQLRIQKTYTPDNHNYIKGGPIFNPTFADV